MKFTIETDTLRAEATSHLGNDGVWEWQVTRAGVSDDDRVRILLRSGQTNERLLDTIIYVLGELASVARKQADMLEHHTALDGRTDERTKEVGP